MLPPSLYPPFSGARKGHGKMAEGGYRPDSVPRRAASIHLGRASPRGSCSQPGNLTRQSGMRGQGPSIPLFGLAPHGVYRAPSVSGEAVRSYRTLSPLPPADPGAVYSLRHFPSRCRGRELPGMPPVVESGPSSAAHAPADVRLLQPCQGYHPTCDSGKGGRRLIESYQATWSTRVIT